MNETVYEGETERRGKVHLHLSLQLKNWFLFHFQWRWPLFVFTLYRVTFTCYVTAWLVLSIVQEPKVNGFYWPMFLTSWAYSALCLHLWTATILTVSHAISHRHFFCLAPPLHRSMGTPISGTDSDLDFQEDGQEEVGFLMPSDRLPWYCKISWMLFSTVANGAIIVSVVYFAALYPQIYSKGQFPGAADFNLHGINSVIILLELALSALPVRLLHAVFTMVFGAAYVTMSALLYAFYSKDAIYPDVLDWNHPGATAGTVCGLILGAVPILQLVLFCLYKLRVFVFRKLYLFDWNFLPHGSFRKLFFSLLAVFFSFLPFCVFFLLLLACFFLFVGPLLTQCGVLELVSVNHTHSSSGWPKQGIWQDKRWKYRFERQKENDRNTCPKRTE